MKTKFTFILFLLLTATLFAYPIRKPDYSKPNKKEVILIGKIQFKDNLLPQVQGYHKMLYPEENLDDFYHIYYIMDTEMNRGYKNWDIGQTFYFDNKPNANRIVSLEGVHVALFANEEDDYFFRIPLNIDVKCPPDSQYIYVGTYEYDMDYAFRIKSITFIDEFDTACEEVKKIYGNSAELVRGILTERKEK